MHELQQTEVSPKSREVLSVDGADFDFKDFFENGGIALHLVGADGTILYANKAELEMLGYPAEQYIGHHISEFYPDQDVIGDILARLGRGEKLDKYPAQMCGSDGSIKHVEVTSSAQFRDGQLVNTRCFTVDVTDLHRAHTELSRQDDQFHQILDSLPVAIFTTDRDGKITYYNRAAADLAGREPEIGKDEWCVTFRLFTPDGKELPHDECPRAIALKENRPVRNQEAVAQRPDGSFFPFLPYPTPIRDEDGSLIGAVNLLLDLSDRQRADEARQHLSAIVESSFDAIVSKDVNGIITSWNLAAERLFGYAADEAIGRPVQMLIPTDHQDEEPRILERIRRGERVDSYETIRQRKDGRLIPVSLTVSPVRNATGQIIGASKIARDISSAKESEQRIRMLMREVNHRVKNQYAVIISMIRETIKRSDNPAEFERQVRERIMALSRSHDLLVLGDWKGVTVFELLLSQAKSFGNEERISMSGPSITLRTVV
ncbi:PAS domain S-box protein, partial [Mesorhizobium metallidurans]|uniref:PAS domain S-box protein n=1 Tax=Mesorhizobium metallidurans TaxID=489722 RepID=UPI000590AB02